ncbi:MAG: ABC transporter ATP-binding protein [SAR324 cluster bacterium]|nr:ABC transporter ATP-binding protein [SAR324 cluster bacterium]
MAYLELSNIVKKFGSTLVLDDINLEIQKGEFLVLVGPSGCGKSTLLNVIAGLETLSAGKIKMNGTLVNDYEPKDRDIAMIFQSYALYPNLTVRENISFGLQNRKLPKSDIENRVNNVSKQLQIYHLLDRKPAQLSGGQRQRVAMGRAISRNPKLYLFDEPLSNLDAKLRIEMRMEIKLLHQRVKNTVVYVTHDQTEAMTLADKIALLNNGKLEQIDTPMNIYKKPANIFVAGFIGSPSMNLIPIKLAQDQREIYFTLENEKGTEFKIYVPESKRKEAINHLDKELILGIRPEHITQPKKDAANLKTLQAIRLMAEPTGSDLFYSFNINGTTTIGRYQPDFVSKKNELIAVQINIDNILFFEPNTSNLLF